MSQKSVLITGCAKSGLGHVYALEFQKRGYHVFATARDVSSMSDLSHLPNITLLQLDQTKPEDIGAAVKAVEAATNGRLDVLINNAAAMFVAPLIESDLTAARETFETNVWGPIALCQAFAPMLIRSKGCIVNMSSLVWMAGWPFMAAYSASKGALSVFSDCLRYELEAFGVRVIDVMAGGIQTEYYKKVIHQPLPADSLYKPFQKTLDGMHIGVDEPGVTRITKEAMARQVADDVESGTNGRVWRGGGSTVFRILNHLPGFLMSYLVKTATHLYEFVQAIQQQEKMAKDKEL